MNLIEQLGGYAQAKALQIRRAMDGLLHEYDFQLVDALLEYRRQHNIFEIDDYVVNEHPDTIEAVFQVENLTPKLKKPKTLRCGRWGNYPVGCNSVRHATPEEIKAGRRL